MRLSSTRYYANSLRHAKLPAHGMGTTTHQRELMGVGWDAERRQFEARIWTRWGTAPTPAGAARGCVGCRVCAESPWLCASTGIAPSHQNTLHQPPASTLRSWTHAITRPASGALLLPRQAAGACGSTTCLWVACCFRLRRTTCGAPGAAALSCFLFVCRDGSEHILIGLFATPEQAAQEYDQAALDMHGTEAFTNFASESCIGIRTKWMPRNGSQRGHHQMCP